MVSLMNSTDSTTASRKKIIRKVSTRFFQDDTTGGWGLTHADTQNGHNGDEGFNAFWDGQGIFHDIFEHAHEHTDKHFRGLYAMNIGGEVAAMGALWFYYDVCGMHSRLNSRYYSPDDITLRGTFDMMQEAIESGNYQFGNTLESAVPTQKDSGNYGLENIIREHFDRIQDCAIKSDDERDAETGKTYKESVTLEKLANLYRYGFRMAEKLIGDESSWNADTLTGFKNFWDEFCKKNRAEEMAQRYRGIDFTIYKDAEGLIHWKAQFTKQPGDYQFEPCILKGGAGSVPFVPSLGW